MNKLYYFFICLAVSQATYVCANSYGQVACLREELKARHEVLQKQHDEQRYYAKQTLVQTTAGAIMHYVATMNLQEFAQENPNGFKAALLAYIAVVGIITHYSCEKKEREASNPVGAMMVGGLSQLAGAALMGTNMGSMD